MKFLVAWKTEDNKRKHFGTVKISDKYLIAHERNREGISCTIAYYFDVDGKPTISSDKTSIVKVPLSKDIKIEVLTEEEFEIKYSRDENGFFVYE